MLVKAIDFFEERPACFPDSVHHPEQGADDVSFPLGLFFQILFSKSKLVEPEAVGEEPSEVMRIVRDLLRRAEGLVTLADKDGEEPLLRLVIEAFSRDVKFPDEGCQVPGEVAHERISR